jgi:hypothetical protein
VNRLIEARNYQEAATHTHRVLHRETPVHNEASFEIIRQLEGTLREHIVDAHKQAQAATDLAASLDWAKALPLVDLPYQGLVNYAQVVRAMLKEELGTKCLTLASQPRGAVVPYAELLTSILDAMGQTIQKHIKVMQEVFAPGAHLRLLQEMQQELDVQAVDLVKSFTEKRELLSLEKQIRSRRGNRSDTGEEKEHPGLEPRLLDAVLEEVAYICRECELFDANLRSVGAKAKIVLSAPGDGGPGARSQAAVLRGLTEDKLGANLTRCTVLNEEVQRLSGFYIALEEHFMVRNVKKAIHIDQHIGEAESGSTSTEDGPGLYSLRLAKAFGVSHASTMVDDIFYLLKKCTERAFSINSATTACAVINHINAILSRDYKEVLHARIATYAQDYGTGGEGVFSTKIFSGSEAAQSEKRLADDQGLLFALNNLSVSEQHLSTLREHLLTEFSAGFGDAADSAVLELGFSELAETGHAFNKVVTKGMTVLLNTLKPRLNPLVDSFLEVEYAIVERDFRARDLEDPWMAPLVRALEAELAPVLPCLMETNVAVFVGSVVDHLVNRLELLVLKRSYSFWGGLQLDKDVRQLSAYFSRSSQHTVRDKMARLVQMANILQLERPSEILDYWGDGNEVWRLSADEVRRVLALRADFQAKDISNLKL